jgi:hypothetical protein
MERLFNSEFNLREKVKQIILNNTEKSNIVPKKSSIHRKRIMLVDEVDVFFSDKFFGKVWRPGFTIKSKSIEQLANYVWNNKKEITHEKIVESEEFKACLKEYPTIETILRS